MHEEVELSRQLERMKNWKDPIVDAVVATILYKRERPGNHISYLVTERLRGAAKGHHQAHHGGFIKPTDLNVACSAAREVREETGFPVDPGQIEFVGRFGPELYRSFMREEEDDRRYFLTLEISKIQAEPGIPFVMDLFAADVTGMRRSSKTDKEVKIVGWFGLDTLLAQYKRSETFNYWNFLCAGVEKINGGPLQPMGRTSPGEYLISWV